MTAARKILIVMPNWIGDCLMAEPLLQRLKTKLGQVKLHALAPAWVAPVLKRMTALDEVISTPFVHGPLQLKERWRLGRALGGLGYTQAIVLPNSWKSALIPFFADIPLRIGYVGESRYALLNVLHKTEKKKQRPMREHYAQLAELPGIALPAELTTPTLRQDAASTAMTLAKLGVSSHGEIAAFCIGAEYGPAKRWPAAHWATLATNLRERGAQIWLLGSANESALADEILARQPDIGITNLCGKTTLDEAIDLLGASSYAVTNDSGLMHVAAALGKPLVALYGSSSATHTPPLSALAQIVEINDLPCRPCFARTCPLGHFKCMNDLPAERVLRILDQADFGERIR